MGEKKDWGRGRELGKVCVGFFFGDLFLGGDLFFGGRERVEEGVCGFFGVIYIERGGDPQDLCGRTVLKTENNNKQ
jgi:hypothetical protein